jgi:hypothetical protein
MGIWQGVEIFSNERAVAGVAAEISEQVELRSTREPKPAPSAQLAIEVRL